MITSRFDRGSQKPACVQLELHVAVWPRGQILLAVRNSHLLLFNPPIKNPAHSAEKSKREPVGVCLYVRGAGGKETRTQTHTHRDHQATWVYLVQKFTDEEKKIPVISTSSCSPCRLTASYLLPRHKHVGVPPRAHYLHVSHFLGPSLPSCHPSWYLKTLKQHLFQLMIGHYWGKCAFYAVHSYRC